MKATITDKPTWWTSDYWETPPEFVANLEREFGKFDLDPCCIAETAKAPKFYTEKENGLSKPWKGKVFLNPPYSKPGPWLFKYLREIECGNSSLVVALIPPSVDTKWFHEFVKERAEIRFVRGRIRFLGWMHTPIGSPKQGNILAIYRKNGFR
jgi:phage N-6-adenine-methyltransferase